MFKGYRRRVKLLFCVFFCLGLYLVNCLLQIQVKENISWALRAVNQRSDSLPLYRQRGAILDRFGQALTGRDHRTYLAIFPERLMEEEKQQIMTAMGDQLLSGQKLSPVIISNPNQNLLALAQHRKLHGLTLCTLPLRYASKPLANHLLGYLHPSGGQGIAGLEYLYEEDLRSDTIVNLALTADAHQRPIPGLGWKYREVTGEKPPKNLVLTIDLKLQQVIEELLDEEQIVQGALLLAEVGTGKIVALASRPVFDPYEPQKSINAPHAPLLNRALQAYPAGTLFDVALAAAALEAGIVTARTTFYDSGRIEIGSTAYYCYPDPSQSHGLLTFAQAIAYSCRPVCGEVMKQLGREKVLAMGRKLGLGQVTGLGLPGEAAGYLPVSAELKDEASLLLGKQEVLVTPVQMAGLFQAIAGNGIYYPPLVVEGLQTTEADWDWRALQPQGEKVLSAQTVAELREILESVVLYGTGKKAQIRESAAGLTGTARSGKVDPAGRELYYGWFAGYAPAFHPRLVGVVLLEEEPRGGERAAEVFGEMMRRCLELY
ncbi:MAG: penicillin-binding protein 2 [Firmicutes bacterium]|nr:penicillin-binding protein 2 [Bacillota bacterium]